MSSDQPVDFESVRNNAIRQGVALSEIAIVYENLTDDEIEKMEEQCLITHKNGNVILARFGQDGHVLYPNKATGVLSLSS